MKVYVPCRYIRMVLLAKFNDSRCLLNSHIVVLFKRVRLHSGVSLCVLSLANHTMAFALEMIMSAFFVVFTRCSIRYSLNRWNSGKLLKGAVSYSPLLLARAFTLSKVYWYRCVVGGGQTASSSSLSIPLSAFRATRAFLSLLA